MLIDFFYYSSISPCPPSSSSIVVSLFCFGRLRKSSSTICLSNFERSTYVSPELHLIPLLLFNPSSKAGSLSWNNWAEEFEPIEETHPVDLGLRDHPPPPAAGKEHKQKKRGGNQRMIWTVLASSFGCS